MKISVNIDLDDIFSGDESLSEIIEGLLRSEIEKRIKKHPDYQKYLDRAVSAAIAKISL